MARGSTQSLLTSPAPSAFAKAQINIGHVQLRDLIICPSERGIVNYVRQSSIIEHNLLTPHAPPRTLADLPFVPNSLTSLPIQGTNHTLIAAGGQEAEVHLSVHAPSSSPHQHTRLVWQHQVRLKGSINNSILLTSLSLNRSNESSAEPRIAISNNDCCVTFYDIPLRASSTHRQLKEVGHVALDVPVNHSSISPDGRTLLSVGDSSNVYLHHITGGSRINFQPIMNLKLPFPDPLPFMLYSSSSSLAASFSTAFNEDGTKFVVASQEGVVAIWDVRSTKPLKVYQTDKARQPGGAFGATGNIANGAASGYVSDDPWEWTRGSSKAPGWSVRSVKFGYGGARHSGKEIMAFTEHTSRVHIVDARTFETEEVIRMPSVPSVPAIPPVSREAQLQQSRQHKQERQERQDRMRQGYVTLSRRRSVRPRQNGGYDRYVNGTQSGFEFGGRDDFDYDEDEESEQEEGIFDSSAITHNGVRQAESEVQNLLGRYEQLRRRQLAMSTRNEQRWESRRTRRDRMRLYLGNTEIGIGRQHPEDEAADREERQREREGDQEEDEMFGLELAGVPSEQLIGATGDTMDEDNGDVNTGSTHGDYEYRFSPPPPLRSPAYNSYVGGRVRRGLRSLRTSGSMMENDNNDHESDCSTSRNTSRAASPAPIAPVPPFSVAIPGGGTASPLPNPTYGVLRRPTIVPPSSILGSTSPASYRSWTSGYGFGLGASTTFAGNATNNSTTGMADGNFVSSHVGPYASSVLHSGAPGPLTRTSASATSARQSSYLAPSSAAEARRQRLSMYPRGTSCLLEKKPSALLNDGSWRELLRGAPAASISSSESVYYGYSSPYQHPPAPYRPSSSLSRTNFDSMTNSRIDEEKRMHGALVTDAMEQYLNGDACEEEDHQALLEEVNDMVIYEDDLDLAGICFDRTGRWMYVASTEGVAEWGVKGMEKKWFSGGSWA